MKERMLRLGDKLLMKRQEKEVIIQAFLLIASQTSVDIIKIFLIKKIEDRKARFKYFPGALSDVLHYVNPTLEESEFDIAIIHVGINDLLNCEGDINQINNILRNIEQ